MQIRVATRADVPAMTDILNWAIAETDVIFRAFPARIAEREELFDHVAATGTQLVAEEDGELLGFAYYKPFGDPAIWIGSHEDTIYVSPAAHGRGVGTALLGALIEAARADERVHTLLARITTNNATSVALHEKFGFVLTGTLREVTRKFDAWLDLHTLQLIL